MGKTVMILVLVAIVIVSSIFVALSSKQLKAVDVLSDKSYTEQARHIANTYAHHMIRETKAHLDSNDGDISNLASVHLVNLQDVMGVPNSVVNTRVYRGTYNGQPLDDTFFMLESVADVTSPDGDVYTFTTTVLYEYTNYYSEENITIEEGAVAKPGNAWTGNNVRITDGIVEMYNVTSNIPSSNWNSVWGKQTLDYPSNNFESHASIIYTDKVFRIIGQNPPSSGNPNNNQSGRIDKSFMIVSDGDIYVQTNIYRGNPDVRIILQSANRIIIDDASGAFGGTINRIEADLYAKQVIVGTSNPRTNDRSIITNWGGRIFADPNHEIKFWDFVNYPDGVVVRDSTIIDAEYFSILRSWNENPIQIERN